MEQQNLQTMIKLIDAAMIEISNQKSSKKDDMRRLMQAECAGTCITVWSKFSECVAQDSPFECLMGFNAAYSSTPSLKKWALEDSESKKLEGELFLHKPCSVLEPPHDVGPEDKKNKAKASHATAKQRYDDCIKRKGDTEQNFPFYKTDEKGILSTHLCRYLYSKNVVFEGFSQFT